MRGTGAGFTQRWITREMRNRAGGNVYGSWWSFSNLRLVLGWAQSGSALKDRDWLVHDFTISRIGQH